MVLHDVHSMYIMFHITISNHKNANIPICNINSRLINDVHPSRTTYLIYTKL